MKRQQEREVTVPTRLCDEKGNVNPAAIGFARRPLIDCHIPGHYLRKKKWNYWCIYGEDILISATISHLDYAAVCFVYFIEYETQRYCEKTVVIPLAKNVKMTTQVLDSIQFSHNDMTINCTYNNGITHLSINIADFENEHLVADLFIQHPTDDETLNVVIPWKRQMFQFTAKHHTLPTSGTVQIGDKIYPFYTSDCFAVLDYGRGVWPRKATWNWAMASQLIGDKRIGLNFGGQWTDGTGVTENAFFIDGKMFKINEEVQFTYNRANYKQAWTIRSKSSNQVQLTFTPFFERVAKTDVKVITSEVHQLVGYYHGTITLQDGEPFHIQQMLGCIEEHIAKW